MNALKKRPIDFDKATRVATGYKSPTFDSIERIAEAYARFNDRFLYLGNNLANALHKHLAVRLAIASPPVIGQRLIRLSPREAQRLVDQTVAAAAHALREELLRQGFKPVRWNEDCESGSFAYRDVEQHRGLLRHTVRTTPHKHTITRANIRRLDDPDVRLSAKAQALSADLDPDLRRVLRVVVGTEIVRDVGAESVQQQWTPLAKRVARVGKIAGQSAALAGIGAAIVGAGALLGTAAATAVSSLGTAAVATVVVADPALILGDMCLIGWEE